MARVAEAALLFALGILMLIRADVVAGQRSPSLSGSSDATGLETVAERSGFRQTGRYDEVQRLCLAYEQTWPDAVKCVRFGETPEKRPMLALVATRTGMMSGEEAAEREIPVMLFQGGIHAGEIEGKDAGFLALREMLEGKAAPRALESIVLVFVPVLNPDGHERFGRWNRPNQNGPEEMGWRATAQNLNLNRDYTKADALEMRELLRLLADWDPILYVDLHATDGAQFEHDVANLVEPMYTGDWGMQGVGRRLLNELNAQLTKQGSLPLGFYPSFVVQDDPSSGFKVSPYPPRYSTGYWALRNRFAVLVETHSWKDYPTRVRVTRNVIVTLAEMTARRGAGWLAVAREADDRSREIKGQDVALDYEVQDRSRTIEFRGYAYTREMSPISGAMMIRYDPTRPEIWRVPLRDRVRPKIVVRAPRGGYIIPPVHADWMAERLNLHGLRFGSLDGTTKPYPVEIFRATKVEFSARPREGRTTATLSGKWENDRRVIPPGSLFVPVGQPKARLVMALLEPQSPDSYAAWGFFNAFFEAKEYMENYVAEQVAREMLESDRKVAEEFKKRLAEDPQFAADPAARLEFFYRRHPSWDERLNLYPIYRAAAAP